MSIWKRFIAVIRPDFAEQVLSEKNSRKSWQFWFLSNSILTIIILIAGISFARPYIKNFPENALNAIPNSIIVQEETGENIAIRNLIENFEIEIIDGEIKLSSIPDPAIIVFNEDDGNARTVITTEGLDRNTPILVIDSSGENFDENVAGDFTQGVFVFKDKAIIKNAQNGENNIIYFKDIEENFVLNYPTIKRGIESIRTEVLWFLGLFFGIGLYLFLTCIRLFSALWWALLFGLIGNILKIENWSFEKSLEVNLNIMLPIFIIDTALMIGGFSFFGLTTLLFTFFYGMNFWHIKQQ